MSVEPATETHPCDAGLLTPALSEREFSISPDCSVPQTSPKPQDNVHYERKMGDTELSYYLPSRQSGVNDMYLHLGFRAPEHLVNRSRVLAVWAYLRLKHPLLSARVQMHDYDDVRFVYPAPPTAADALRDANANLEYRAQSKDELIDGYLNGPRTLSNTRLSYLIISRPGDEFRSPTPPPSPKCEGDASNTSGTIEGGVSSSDSQLDFMLCATHFLGDGMALHQTAHTFFNLLGSEKTDAELEQLVIDEWRVRWENTPEEIVLPISLEDNIALNASRFRKVAAAVDFQLSQQKLVGGQAFPRRKHPERRTIVPTISFPEDRTKAMLKKCKAQGVSISAALFAVCNIAWARVGDGPKESPTLMYSALNLRPYFTATPAPTSFWFLAIGYFNVVLPNFLPKEERSVEATFWHRARQAKDQSARAARHPLLVSRTQEMAVERGQRARVWAKEDDEKEKGTWIPPAPVPAPLKESILPARSKAPSAALIGLSLLGNLDAIYKHPTFPSIKLHTLTTGSRQRHGAMLLFGYTFAGKLWVSLGYDENGFKEGVVDSFWTEVNKVIDEFLA